MTPQQELERFFRGFPASERENVERYPEYHKAIAAGNMIAAMEIASAIITSGLDVGQLQELFRKRFRDFSN